MTTIRYFDLSGTPLTVKTGETLEVDELVQLALSGRLAIPEEILELQHLTENDVDIKCLRQPTKWEGFMTLLVWSLSNKVPSRQEVLRGRQLLMSLPKNIKRDERLRRLTFSFLPYLLTGFKSHVANQFQADSNSVQAMATFVHKLSAGRTPVFESFLCAHRGKGGSERFYLVDNVHHIQAKTALHLLKGLQANNPWSDSGLIRWFQQGPTEFASLNMFPEMFLRYLESGEIADLLIRLDRHFTQVKQLDSVPTNGIDFQLNDLDGRSQQVLAFLSEVYGQAWRRTNYDSLHFESDPIVQVALADTLPLMLRQMPFYKSHEVYKDFSHRKRQLVLHNQTKAMQTGYQVSPDQIDIVVERFYELQNMHPTAKALYETVFYYLWGMTAEKTGVFSIGIDRDHDTFQAKAWLLGAKATYRAPRNEPVTSSLLYARRNAEKIESSFLRDFSVRQFWR